MPRRTAIAAVLTGLLTCAAIATASADAPANACESSYVAPMNSTQKLKNYVDCRDDRIEAKLDRILAAQSPSSTPSPTPSPSASSSPTATATPTPTPTPTPSPTPTATATAVGICKPGTEIVKFNGQGSAGLAQYGQGDYDASAELWGVNGYNYEQVMGVCSHSSWYIDVRTDNTKGDGAVKAYPSVRRIYWDYSTTDGNLPLVSSFPRLQTTFAATPPASCSGCIYNVAYDVWLNGIGNGVANELMIWTANQSQVPYGTKVASGVQLAGHTWDLWTGNTNHYIAFVPTDVPSIPSGTFDIKDFTSYLIAQGKIPSATKLGQISYGVEMVSTNAVTKHFDFTDFSVTDR